MGKMRINMLSPRGKISNEIDSLKYPSNISERYVVKLPHARWGSLKLADLLRSRLSAGYILDCYSST